MTFDEFLALPNDGVERWLARGVLWESDPTIRFRTRDHGATLSRVGSEVMGWNQEQPEPRGAVFAMAAFRLQEHPPTVVVADVAYVSARVMARQTDEVPIVDGVPTLAVDILSPHTTQREIQSRISLYREAGTPLVWVMDPVEWTVLVYQPGEEPALFNVGEELTAEPHLPGFRVPVARLFP